MGQLWSITKQEQDRRKIEVQNAKEIWEKTAKIR